MDWHNRRVVVIDDEAPSRWLLALLLREQGAKVYLASDGQSGLKLVDEHRPDLVILDILLPGMNGWEVLQRLRKSSDVPVVVLTSTSTPESEAKCLNAGADDHVAKPFQRDVLLARCRTALRRYTTPARSTNGRGSLPMERGNGSLLPRRTGRPLRN